MYKFKKTGIIASIFFAMLSLLPFFALAQDPGGDPDLPIDGGIGFLLAAGAAYGVKKYRDHKKNQTEGGEEEQK